MAMAAGASKKWIAPNVFEMRFFFSYYKLKLASADFYWNVIFYVWKMRKVDEEEEMNGFENTPNL